jgi:hypothetical protein
MIKVKRQRKSRIFQGDVYKDIEFIEYAEEKSEIIEVSKILFPNVLVLTQDCDLAQDYKFRFSRDIPKNQDKWLISVLVVPIYNKDQFLQGEHLSYLEMRMMNVKRGSTHQNKILNNQDQRFHYIEFPPDVPIVPSIIDFKHYFSVNVNYLKKVKPSHFICRISELYREDISHRFASFLSRIGLP